MSGSSISVALASCSDHELTDLVRASTMTGIGVGGGASVAHVDGVPVFVKRIPITDRELASPHATANLFDLPVRHQYGMYRLPLPAFNAWRELAANQIFSAVPALHHWRVLPGRPPIPAEHRDIDTVVDYFGGDRAVRARLEALAGATASLVLFLEHLPGESSAWLADPIGRAGIVERQLFEAVDTLRRHELLHLDGHFGNIRTRGDRLHLVDFGLATSPRFDLSDAERAFAERNAGHDADYASMRLVNWLSRVADPPESITRIIERHASAAARMNDFVHRLWDGDLTATYSPARR